MCMGLQGEINKIVKQRTNFEYRLKRRGAKKVDYLRYIEYEMNLDALRVKRKTRLGKWHAHPSTIWLALI
jgi:hypothetical protein